MGMIDTQKSVFPYGKRGQNLDVLARRYLYDVGLEYGHRTGHGIGLFLCIHEGIYSILSYCLHWLAN